MNTLKITNTRPVTAMRSAGDFDAMWRDMSDATPDLWSIAQEPLPELFAPWEPRIALIAQEDAYLLRTHLPGIQPDDITVECHQALLTLRGEQSIDSQHRPYVKHGSRAFTRRFVLDEPVAAEALAVTYTPDGIEISIPKAVPVSVG